MGGKWIKHALYSRYVVVIAPITQSTAHGLSTRVRRTAILFSVGADPGFWAWIRVGPNSNVARGSFSFTCTWNKNVHFEVLFRVMNQSQKLILFFLQTIQDFGPEQGWVGPSCHMGMRHEMWLPNKLCLQHRCRLLQPLWLAGVLWGMSWISAFWNTDRVYNLNVLAGHECRVCKGAGNQSAVRCVSTISGV